MEKAPELFALGLVRGPGAAGPSVPYFACALAGYSVRVFMSPSLDSPLPLLNRYIMTHFATQCNICSIKMAFLLVSLPQFRTFRAQPSIRPNHRQKTL